MMAAAIGPPDAERKISSPPSSRHTGELPPSRETFARAPATEPGGEKERMYTSLRPDSFEVYATQWPSGENVACDSLSGVWRNGATRRSPSIVSRSISSCVLAAPILVRSRNRPSRDQLVGVLWIGDCNRTSALPTPLVRF